MVAVQRSYFGYGERQVTKMTGQEFLQKLELELLSLDAGQRQEVMAYFVEYVEEAGDDAVAIAELGSPTDVAAELIDELKEREILADRTEVVHTQSSHQISNISVQLLDLDVVFETADVADVRLNYSEKVEKILAIDWQEHHLNIRQTESFEGNSRMRFGGLSINFGNRNQNKLTIVLPQNFLLEKLDVETTFGDVVCEGVNLTQMKAELTNGDLEIGASAIRDCYAKLVNGDVELTGSQCGKLELDLMNGDVEVGRTHFESVKFKLMNGDAELEQVIVREDCKISNQNGDIEVDSCRFSNFSSQQSNGDFEMDESYFTRVAVVETNHGDIDITLPQQQLEKSTVTVAASYGDFRLTDMTGTHSGENGSYTAHGTDSSVSLKAKSHYGDVEVDFQS